jgi:transposase
MVTFGVDVHKRTHTIVAVNDRGTPVGQTTVGTTSQDHLVLLRWAARFGAERRWAVEDCRHLSRRLERDLLAAGESIMRVPPKLMAHVRDPARTYGKSDPIDALAVARAAQREPNLPLARLDGPDREVRLLVDHRESLISERTRLICRLRWHLHELDPAWEPKARSLDAQRTLDEVRGRLQDHVGVVARLAVELTERCAELTITIKALEKEITELTTQLAPALLELPGCGALTAAKIIGETAGVDRFKSRDAYARFNGTAPLPVWSSNKARHRLSRTGNRQLNAALHRIALTQARWHPPAKAMIDRRKNSGNSGREAIRILKRRLSNAVFQALVHDQTDALMPAAKEEQVIDADLDVSHTRQRLQQFGMTNTLYSLGREAAGLVCLHNYPQSLQHITRPDGEVIDLAAIDVLRKSGTWRPPLQRVPTTAAHEGAQKRSKN